MRTDDQCERVTSTCICGLLLGCWSSLASHLANKKVAPNSKLDTKRGDVQVYYRWRISLCFQNSLIQAKVKEQLAFLLLAAVFLRSGRTPGCSSRQCMSCSRVINTGSQGIHLGSPFSLFCSLMAATASFLQGYCCVSLPALV